MAVLDLNVARAHSVHARGHFQRATLTASSAEATETVVVTVDNAHKSAVKGLAALVVILSLLIMGVAAWRIGVWRRNKIRAASNSVNVASMQNKQSRKAVPLSFDDGASLSQHPEAEKLRFDVASPGAARVTSPPPTYAATANRSASPSRRPSLPAIATRPPGIQPPPSAMHAPRSPLVPTPRTSSFNTTVFDTKTPATAPPKSSARRDLPRMVVVKVSFVPTLADELPITVGEKLALVDAYEDGWCQVQRADGDKGVIPQFCIQ